MRTQQTVRILRIVMPIVAVICMIVLPPWELVWAWMKPLPESVQEEVNKAMGHGFDGMIVYVDQAGEAPQFFAAGWKNREEQIPADPKALFKIASISKLYVATAIAKLVHSKHLSLDKTLAEYFPELAGRIEYAEKITLKMMIQHRSGIPNFTDHPGFWSNPPANSKEALEYALDLPANFEPGEEYGYCNTNYLLLSLLIDKVLGYSHHQYIKEEILLPLGLKNTYSTIHEVNLEDVMSGYYVGVEADIKTSDYGSMLATAEDVGIFLRALNDGSLFKEGEQEVYSSIYVYEHTGLIPGYQSIAKYHKDIDTVIIQFINTTNFEGYTWTLSEIVYSRIVKILRGKKSV